MNNPIKNLIICSTCRSEEVEWHKDKVKCRSCLNVIRIQNDICRYVETDFHSNFGFQWNKFSKVQLDSINGSGESESRLFNQSKLEPKDLNGKSVLEVGCGNGRFTEILLKYGANVLAIDGSSAIDANKKNHQKYIDEAKLVLIQADLFSLPIKEHSFDFVLCYGVIQHTGDNKKAIKTLAKYPKVGGSLLLDIYSAGIRHLNPIIYLIRAIIMIKKRKTDDENLKTVIKFVNFVFPYQVKILKILKGKSGILKFIRYIINRSPNSVYGINLFLDNKITKELAYDWSVMDTYDSWFPSFDHPVSKRKWYLYMNYIKKNYNYNIEEIGIINHGLFSVLKKLN
tara:strand:- start:186 stop:1208 length:1023 start_codon:yes stop_codon:yes gene_type:complete